MTTMTASTTIDTTGTELGRSRDGRHLGAPTGAAPPKVTERRAIRAEWIKLRTVRSSMVALLGAGAVGALLGAMFSSFAGSDAAAGPAAVSSDPLQLALGGFTLVSLIIGTVGVLVSGSEYASGLIRTTFSAVTSRVRVLRAKSAVVGSLALVVGAVSAFTAVALGRLTYAGTAVVPDLLSGEVLRAVLGIGVYVAGIAVIGVCLGFLFRSTAAGVGILAVTLLIVPALVQLLPDSAGDLVSRILPSSAGAAFANEAVSMTNRTVELLSPGAGLAVFAAWVVGLLAVSAWSLRHRDA
jgi:ABC-2 type transport system permease protein